MLAILPIAVAALEPHFRARLYELLALDEGSDPGKTFKARTAAEWESWALEHDLPIVHLLDEKMLPFKRPRRIDTRLGATCIDLQHEVAAAPFAVEPIGGLREWRCRRNSLASGGQSQGEQNRAKTHNDLVTVRHFTDFFRP